MSTEDHARFVGDTVLAFVASKHKLAALQSEVARMAQQLEEGAAALRDRASEPAICNSFIGLATYDKIRVLTDDLHAEQRRYEGLLSSIRGFGLEV